MGRILDGAIRMLASLDGANFKDVVWDDSTQWENAQLLDKAINLPEEWKS